MKIRSVLLIVIVLTLGACDKPEPIRIGFVAGLSGKVSDLGEAERNGVLLAVEQTNARGGIVDRPIELLIRDDRQDRETAVAVVNELIDAGVEGIIGPMTSSMAMVMEPIVTERGVLMISPTATTTRLSNRDDMFFRVIGTTNTNARFSAEYLVNDRHLKRAAASVDSRNAAYTQAWLDDFKLRFEELGGKLVNSVAFNSGNKPDHLAIIEQMAKSNPDVMLFISSAVDTARFAQVARQVVPEMPLSSVEWAASETLVELGGKAVNGMTLTQFFNREDQSEDYLAYKNAYQKRYQRTPGFADVAAYDAANALFYALRHKKSGQSLKQALIDLKNIPALQQAVVLNEYGDSARRVYMTQIENGQYRLVK